ncbi:hypothetical protein WJX72_007559 [[Myrmecia] bisecta]|uniref:EF-hand domain-containing protein n=1 Tax=[Myrmecia] bisecta TaxID=41462 RepID=A0AAW1Q3S7_9CHLO
MQADPQLLQWFNAIDTDRRGTLDVKELQKALALGHLNFSLKMVANLIRAHDQDREGRLNFTEFQNLHRYLMELQQRFASVDVQRTGHLTLPQLEQALAQGGFRLDQGALNALFYSYDAEKDGYVGLPEFIAMSVFMRSAASTFAAFDAQRRGTVTLDFNQFIYAGAQLV